MHWADRVIRSTLRRVLIATAIVVAAGGTAWADRHEARGPGASVIGFPLRPGPIRHLHVTVAQRIRLGFEGAVVGSAQATGYSPARLLGTDVEAIARVSWILGTLEPYLLAGAGLIRYRVTAPFTNVDSGMSTHEDVVEIPFGVGLVGHHGPLYLDLRGTERVMTRDDLWLAPTGSTPCAGYDARHMLVITATLGYEL
jgi:hypothetical protein